MIKFQHYIVNTLDKFDLSSLPHAILLIGDTGSGRHTLINDLALKFGAQVVDISGDITHETLNTMLETTVDTFYIVDTSSIQLREQNKLLKLLEDSSYNSYLFILSDSENNVLKTVYNRCFSLRLNRYTAEELLEFVPTDVTIDTNLLNVLTTPGQVKMACKYVDWCSEYADRIMLHIDKSLISNVLQILDKVTCKKEEDGVSIDLFSRFLLISARRMYESLNIGFSSYLLTSKLCKNLSIPGIDKRKLYVDYLLELKNDVRDFKNRIKK